MKNAFYLLFLTYLNFCPDFFGHLSKRLDKKVKLFSKFMTSQPEKQTITIIVLTHISRSKGNQTDKFGQLIEYNVKNLFLQKMC